LHVRELLRINGLFPQERTQVRWNGFHWASAFVREIPNPTLTSNLQVQICKLHPASSLRLDLLELLHRVPTFEAPRLIFLCKGFFALHEITRLLTCWPIATDKIVRKELADSGFNFHRAKLVLPPA